MIALCEAHMSQALQRRTESPDVSPPPSVVTSPLLSRFTSYMLNFGIRQQQVEQCITKTLKANAQQLGAPIEAYAAVLLRSVSAPPMPAAATETSAVAASATLVAPQPGIVTSRTSESTFAVSGPDAPPPSIQTPAATQVPTPAPAQDPVPKLDPSTVPSAPQVPPDEAADPASDALATPITSSQSSLPPTGGYPLLPQPEQPSLLQEAPLQPAPPST